MEVMQEIRVLTFVLLLLKPVWCQLFIESPGTKKHHPGETLTMEWRLSQTFDPSISGAYMEVEHGGSTFILETNGGCGIFGDTRLSCISPGTKAGFTIGGSGVTYSDAGGYSCTILVDQFGTSETDADALLYIYKEPTKPNITRNSPTPVGGTLNLQCSASPQSVPLDASADIEYKWISSLLPLSPGGDTVTVGPLNKEDLGKTVTCEANEQGSTLTSSQQVSINVTFAPVTTLLKANSVIVVERVEDLILSCTIPDGHEGNPDFYTYKWMNPGSNIEPTETGMTLTIDKASLDANIHQGTWSCSASNVAGNSSASDLEITVNSAPMVTTDLFDTSLIVNETLKIECQFRAKPQANITWKFNNGNLPTEVLTVSNSNSLDGVYTTSSSIISWEGTDLEARKTVGGQYRCDASNGITGVVSSATMTLQVKYPPGICDVDADTDIVVEKQDDLVLTCTLPPDQQGIPDSYTFLWENLNTGFTKDTGTTNELIIASGVLDASKHDGNWQCLPRNEIDHGSPGSIKITVNAKPVVHKDLVDLNVTINASLHMECSFKAKPEAAISWFHNDTLAPSTDAFIISNSDTSSGVYTISSSVIRWKPGSNIDTRKAVNGFYKCEGDNNPTGSGMTHNMRLNIHFGPLSIDFGVDGQQEEVTEPSQVTRSCFADCNPACSYQWRNLTSGAVVSNSQTLDISSAVRYDDGEYRCTAHNGIWNRTNDFDLIVNFAPEPEVSISNEHNLIQGNRTSLTCTVESRPLSTITLRNMTDNSVLTTDDSDNLAVHHIASVDCLQSGNYNCSATNDIPNDDHTVTRAVVMDIKCPPRISEHSGDGAIPIGENYTFQAHLISNPPPTITRNSWTFIPENDTRSVALPPNAYIDQGQPEAEERLTIVPQLHIIDVDVYNFGKYVLTTSNLLSEPLSFQFLLTPQGPPLKPSKPELSCGSAMSLTIFWTANFHGGFPQKFTILYTAAGDTEKEQSVIHNPDVNKGDIVVHKLTGIKSDTTYAIRIKAENSFSGDNVEFGDTDSYDTKALPFLAAGTELDKFNSTYLILTSNLQHVGSVNHIIFEVCTDTDEPPSCSQEVNITVTSADLSVTLALPEEKDNTYKVTLTMFDCQDIVNTTILTADFGNKGLSSAAKGGIAGGVIAVVVIAVVVLALFFIRRRNAGKTPSADESITENDYLGQDNPALTPVADEIPLKPSSSRMPKRGDGSVRMNTSSSGIAVSKFQEYVRQILTTEKPFEGEYESLPHGKLFDWDAAVQHESLKDKNRFKNILPYDRNRVHLTILENDPLSDYINASYIKGYTANDKFIASQAPTGASVVDFWRMLWEKDVHLVVMLTNCVELGGKRKCEYYWPRTISKEIKECGEISVKMTKEDVWPDFTIRSFIVTKNGAQRIMSHCHFTAWPDHGVPDCGTALIAFWDIASRKMIPGKYSVIHCSAGVGRTGTFIAFDYLIKQAEKEHQVDVFGCVEEFRMQRIHMVQASMQYVFLHKAIAQYLMTGPTIIPCADFNNTFSKLNRPTKTGSSQLSQQVQMLKQLALVIRDADKDYPLDAKNSSKNRDPFIIPLLSSRICLTSRLPGKNDYINAVYVNGCKKKDVFMVTQVPSEHTIVDFWRLMVDFNSSTIVLLITDQQYKTMPKFIPTTENPIIVSNNQMARVQGQTSKKGYKVLDVETGEVPPIENVYMNQEDMAQAPKQPSGPTRSMKILMIHMAENRTSVSAESAINAVADVKDWLNVVGEHPITVVCWDGATYSGQFVACYNLIEMVATEQEVDIFRVVKQIRDRRPQFVPNEQQYRGLHDVVKEHIKGFSLYANVV